MTYSLKYTAVALAALLFFSAQPASAQVKISNDQITAFDCKATINYDHVLSSPLRLQLTGVIRNAQNQIRVFDGLFDTFQAENERVFLALSDACHHTPTFCKSGIIVNSTYTFEGEVYNTTREFWPCH